MSTKKAQPEADLAMQSHAESASSAGMESEEDIPQQSFDQYRQAVLWGVDWTTETLIGQVSKENIDLDPDFQRRDVWSATKKSRFIESLFLGLPIPQIVLAERHDERGRFIVLDGKQRILALSQFMRPSKKPLVLKDLTVLHDLTGKTYKGLKGDPAMSSRVAAFQNQTIRAVIFRQWPNADFLRLVFYRLNSNTVTLSPQELRQALFPGPFTKFANRTAGKSAMLAKVLRQKGPDFRMRDVELFVRFMANKRFLGRYEGSMKDFLDLTCSELNAAFGEDSESIRESATQLDLAIEATLQMFGEGKAFSIWRGEEYEGRFNRTVFDLMTYYLSDPKIRAGALKRPKVVKRAFESLCESDSEFVRALEVTTKSLDSTRIRFRKWGARLGKALKLPAVKVPVIGK